MGKVLARGFDPKEDFRSKISKLFQYSEWVDDNFVILEENMLVGSFFLEEDPNKELIIRVYIEGGSDPKRIIKCLCKNYRWLAYDESDEEFMDLEDCHSSGWNNYLNYLRHIGYMGST